MARKRIQELLKHSASFTEYSLRATFFERKLRSLRLWEAIQEVHQLSKVQESFDWSERGILGISSAAWNNIQQQQFSPLLYFCHPRALTENPRLLLYYRTLALLSQKGLGKLVGGNIAKTEQGKVDRLNVLWMKDVIFAVNSILSVVAENAADITAKELPGLQFASAGASIQGSWNNEIGTQGELAIKSILANQLRDELVQIGWRNGPSTDYSEELHAQLLERMLEVRVLRLKHGFHLLFGSEPDISLRNPKDLPVLAIEVKAGSDTAGALERLGAAMKSFENDRNLNPRLKTVYVVRAITPELQNRINESKPFDYMYGLAELLVSEKAQRKFANAILRTILGK